MPVAVDFELGLQLASGFRESPSAYSSVLVNNAGQGSWTTTHLRLPAQCPKSCGLAERKLNMLLTLCRTSECSSRAKVCSYTGRASAGQPHQLPASIFAVAKCSQAILLKS